MAEPHARIIAVQEALVTLRRAPGGPPLVKNTVVHVLPGRTDPDGRTPRLMGEIVRIRGDLADAQVYEDTRGVAVGDPVELSGEMLSVELGPGLLGQVYDGLQNPLGALADAHGTFLPRGVALPALDPEAHWSFHAARARGEMIGPGEVLGAVGEAHVSHKIFAPFDLTRPARLKWIQDGGFQVNDPVAELEDPETGATRRVSLMQRWPVRRALAGALIARGGAARLYPDAPLTTSIRLIDSFFPVARGGTACIPGPFGAGKTVLQNLIARHADVDVVVVVACGERAGEVVETITTFPDLADPRAGGSLMDRTVIVCNTSSMPVAARESSIYTGITIAEYYRQMGLDVLLLADSTSRWAQAMRETSGRLEEIPGEEAFPAYLDSAIKAIYERAGVVEAAGGATGSLTMIGTVSPAGGNFEEPVTQSTLNTVKCFLGLSSERAYQRAYPAIDPLMSWSRYRAQLSPWFERELGAGWSARIEAGAELLKAGDRLEKMMQVTGEEGVSLEDFVRYLKARLIDRAYLQQDAFDAVDGAVSLDRQRRLWDMVHKVTATRFGFPDKDAARRAFADFTRLFVNLNYAPDGSAEFRDYAEAIEARRHALEEEGDS